MAEDGWPGEKRGEERGEYLRRGGNFMCGIVGYVGDEQAAPILLMGLSKLEYRGYDSAGIASEDTY